MRLDRIETALTWPLEKQATKEWYTSAEVTEVVGRAEYIVREWCRQGRVRVGKMENGRGWIVPRKELTRVRNYGPLPTPKYELYRVLDRRGK